MKIGKMRALEFQEKLKLPNLPSKTKSAKNTVKKQFSG